MKNSSEKFEVNQVESIENKLMLPTPEIITQNNVNDFIFSKNQIPEEIITTFNISEEDIRNWENILDNIENELKRKSIIKTSLWVIYLEWEYYEEQEIIKDYFNQVIDNIYVLFYLNPYLTTAILRSWIKWSHFDTSIFFENIEKRERFMPDFLQYITYNKNYTETNQRDNKKLLGLWGFLWVINNNEDENNITDEYSQLTDNQFYSILTEIYHWWWGEEWVSSNSVIKRLKNINFYFYKRVFETKNIPDHIKTFILNFRNNIYIEDVVEINKSNPNVNFLTKEYNKGETINIVEETKQLTSVIQNESEVDENNTAEEIWNIIIDIEPEQHLEQWYNFLWYKLLIEINDTEKREEIFKYIIFKDFKAWIRLLRYNGLHYNNMLLIESLEPNLITQILKEWLVIPEWILDIEWDWKVLFIEKNYFSIIRAWLNLPYEKQAININNLEIEEIAKLIKVIYQIHQIKWYAEKALRHDWKEKALNNTKIKKAISKIKTERPDIYTWLNKRIIKTDISLNSEIDYNLFEWNTFSNLYWNINYWTNKKTLLEIVHKCLHDIQWVIYISKQDITTTSNKLKNIRKTVELYLKNNNTENISILKIKSILIDINNFIKYYEQLIIKSKINNPDRIEKIEEEEKILNLLCTILWRIIYTHPPIRKWENWFNNEAIFKSKKINSDNEWEIKWAIKIITSKKQLEYLSENDIVVLYDYPTEYLSLLEKTKPKAIIMSNPDSWAFSHSSQIWVPIFYIPKAEYLLKDLNWLKSTIQINWDIQIDSTNKYISPVWEDKEWEKSKWLETSTLNHSNISWKIFYKVIQDYYWEILDIDWDDVESKDEESTIKWTPYTLPDYNDIVDLPYEELRDLFDPIINNWYINYDDLSTRSIFILDQITIKESIIEELLIDKNLDFPLALRSDFLNEDTNWKRTAWLKESYLNIRNREELKLYLLKMIKQDFTPSAIQYKIQNNIYPLFCTFWAILQNMLITKENEANNLISWVAHIKHINWETIIECWLCIWLNQWLTSWALWIETDLNSKSEITINQKKIYTIDNENWWTKEKLWDINVDIPLTLQDTIKMNLISSIENKTEKELDYQIEFSVKDWQFILLQNNTIKKEYK